MHLFNTDTLAMWKNHERETKLRIFSQLYRMGQLFLSPRAQWKIFPNGIMKYCRIIFNFQRRHLPNYVTIQSWLKFYFTITELPNDLTFALFTSFPQCNCSDEISMVAWVWMVLLLRTRVTLKVCVHWNQNYQRFCHLF